MTCWNNVWLECQPSPFLSTFKTKWPFYFRTSFSCFWSHFLLHPFNWSFSSILLHSVAPDVSLRSFTVEGIEVMLWVGSGIHGAVEIGRQYVLCIIAMHVLVISKRSKVRCCISRGHHKSRNARKRITVSSLMPWLAFAESKSYWLKRFHSSNITGFVHFLKQCVLWFLCNVYI